MTKAKGIIVEIGGDTSKLENALKKINSGTASLSKELKGVNSLLKLDPKNTQMVAQKQEVLKETIEKTSQRLEAMKSVQDQVHQKWQNYIKNESKIKEIATAIEDTKTELQKLEKQQEKAKEAFDKGKITEQQYNEISNKVKETKVNLSELRKEQKQFNETTVSTEAYRDFNREITLLESNLKKSQLEASKWTTISEKMQGVSDKFKKVGSTLTNIGKKLTTAVSLPIIAVGTVASKSAIEFESAFTGVEKTVDGTAEQMSSLKQGIRDMAKEIPSSTTEISAVAEAAGQLGIKTDDILSFTRVMIDLGNSTNLSADQAASALAKFANITNMSSKDYDRLGSTIVALGNNFATTESDIVEMATRLAATGDLAGLSQPQILALATAMSSVGIEAEAGGSAMSKLLKQIQVAVETGSKKLSSFASVAGMSTSQFKTAFEQDAVGALSAFIGGLNDTERNGKSAVAILDDMGISEVRLSNTILSLANSNDLMTNAVKLGSNAWNENTALADEASKRYQTLESRIQILKQKFSDIGITIGNIVMPYIEKFVEKLGGLAEKFSNMSPGMQEFIVKAGAIVAAIGPVILMLGKLFTATSSIIGGIGKLSGAIAGAKVGIGGLSSAISIMSGPVGIAVLAIGAITAALVVLYNKSETFRNTVNEAFTKVKETLLNAWNTIKPSLEQFGQALGGLLEKLRPIGEFLVNVLGVAFKVIAEIFSVVVQKIVEKINFIIKMVTMIINAWTNIISFFTETIPNAWNNFLANLGSFVQSVIDWFKNLPYNVGIAIGEMIGHIIQFGVSAWNWVTTELPKIINNIVNWFKQLPGKIWSWLVDTINKVGEWINNLRNKVTSTIPNIVNSITDFFKNLPSNMLSIGRNIVEGLWNGIRNATSWIVGKVKEFAKGILDGIKNALGIHSPSVLFRDEVGKNIALGIGEGFIKNVGKTIKQMQNELNVATGKLSGNLVSNIGVVDNIGSINREPQRNVQFVMNFNVQKMTDAEMDRAFKYVDRKFGSKYT